MIKAAQDATDEAFLKVMQDFSKHELWPSQFEGLDVVSCLRFCRQVQQTLHKIKKSKDRFSMIQKFVILGSGTIMEDMLLINKPFLHQLLWGKEQKDERSNYKDLLVRVEDQAQLFVMDRTEKVQLLRKCKKKECLPANFKLTAGFFL